MIDPLDPSSLSRLLRPGLRVYAAGAGGESPVLTAALAATPEAAAGVRFIGVWLPGINRCDYAGLHPQARATAFFVGAEMRRSFAAGRVDLWPIPYSAIYAHLRDRAPIDLALLHVSPPDASGLVSLGTANDFTPAILGKARVKVAHINPLMPRTRGAAKLRLAEIEHVIEAPAPLLAGDAVGDEVIDAIGRRIATLLRDGDVIEVGIGRIQGVFAAFAGLRRLRIHSGAISTPLLTLAGAGAIAPDLNAITTGIAYGNADLYAFVRDDPRIRFATVGETHDPANLRQLERFIAINSVIEVDLFGQANAEIVDGRQVSGAGGIVDFMRGARLSPGGRAIVALPATARSGRVSRIVPALAAGTAVSVARGDAQIVVTEFGIADLRELSIDGRAEALIAIAAPAFRADLETAWKDFRRRM